jgi:hypothetical protein
VKREAKLRWPTAVSGPALALTLGGVLASLVTPGAPPPEARPATAPGAVADKVSQASPVAAPAGTPTLPPEIAERMRRQRPAVEAALAIRKAAVATAGYAGVAVGADGVELRWKGSPPDAVRRVLDGQRVPVRVSAASHSDREVETAVTRIGQVVRKLGLPPGASLSIGADALGGRITVASSEPDRVRAALPDVGIPVRVVKAEPGRRPARPAPSGKATDIRPAAAGIRNGADHDRSAVRVAPVDVWEPPTPSRQRETAPAWGGAHLIAQTASQGNNGAETRNAAGHVVPLDNRWHCSSGFGVVNPDGAELMLTTSACGLAQGQLVSPTGRVLNDTGDPANADRPLDGLMRYRPLGGAEPFIYSGDTWSATGWAVSGWEQTVEGETVCLDGAHTGLRCGEVEPGVGRRSTWMVDAYGISSQITGLTLFCACEPWEIRPYRITDGSTCLHARPVPTEEAWCWQTTGPGDEGTAVFTLKDGASTGVLVKGVLLSRSSGEGGDRPSHYSYFAGVDAINRVWPELQVLTTSNDRP